ncbi:MAG: hypothetical protein R2825_11345 [Saprospiraceae bacterium]
MEKTANRRPRLSTSKPNIPKPQPGLPFRTIQLPIFNEQYVVERLIDNIMLLDYPKDRFEVHVLDDSTDKTLEITQQKVKAYKAQGFQIEQIRALTVKVLRRGH